MNLQVKFQQKKKQGLVQTFFFGQWHSILYAALHEHVYNFKPTEQNPQSPSQSLSAFKFSMFSFSLSRSLVLRVWTKDPWGSSRLSQRVHEIKTFILVILSHQYLLSKYLLSTKKTKDICLFHCVDICLVMHVQWWVKLLVPHTAYGSAKCRPVLVVMVFTCVDSRGGGSFHLRMSDENSKND